MKRSSSNIEQEEVTSHDADVILLDIEGTTTSIKFVKETLFPYVVAEVEKHLKDTWDTEETKSDVSAILKQVSEDQEANVSKDDSKKKLADDHSVNDPSGVIDYSGDKNGPSSVTDPSGDKDDDGPNSQGTVLPTVVSAVHAMVKADRKIPCLKTLQGHMWRKGYAEGKLIGHVYSDVPPMLRKWKEQGKRICIYSSGSIEAQKLIFAHTEEGDLNHLFCGNYDTSSGPKTEWKSYCNIAADIEVPPSRIMFVTDVAAECRAALKAGLQVLLSERPGTVSGALEGETWTTISTFEQISFTTSPSGTKKVATEL